MLQRKWQGSGLEYTIPWGNQSWTLELRDDHPGLRTANRPGDRLLALGGIATVGRCDSNAISAKSLVKVEALADRLEATYVVSRLGGLEVRACWSPTSGYDGIDLQVQVSASSVGELRGLEAIVFSCINVPCASPDEPRSIWVQPRDSRSARFSYDGRVPAADLRRLTTMPLADFIESGRSQVTALGPGSDFDWRYLEMVHPHDVARRIFLGQSPADPAIAGGLHIRYALFGHDLEKGVIIRARIRGLWISGDDIAVVTPVAARDFLETPLPLGP